jgi:hypothetical protein
MGFTHGAIDGPFNSTAAIAFQLGDEFASRIVDTARYGTVIYAAVRSTDHRRVFGLVMLAERRGGVLYTMPISEEMGPAEDSCPERILDQLTDPPNDRARDWRNRCRTRVGLSQPKLGQVVLFREPIRFFDGTEHRRLTFLGGSRFRARQGVVYHVGSWWELDFEIAPAPVSALDAAECSSAEASGVRCDPAPSDCHPGRRAAGRNEISQRIGEGRRQPDARAADDAARRHQLTRRGAG